MRIAFAAAVSFPLPLPRVRRRSGIRFPVWYCIIAAFACCCACRAEAGFGIQDLEFSLFVNDRMHVLNRFYSSGREDFDLDRDLHVLYLNPSLSFSPASHVRICLEVEGQFTFDFRQDDDDSDIDLRNAYVRAALPKLPWLAVSIGQQALRTMDGFVYDDESPCARMTADFERGFSVPLKMDALVAEIEHRSPYVSAELKYCYSLLESVRLSYGWFRDFEGGVARIFDYLDRQRLYASRGRVQWMGISATKFIGHALLTATGILERGSATLRKKGAGAETIATRGYLFDVGIEYVFRPGLSAELFLYLASGDSNPRTGTLKSFLAIDPYVDRTNIYFNGGIDSQYSSDSVGLGGIQPAGVIAPGISLDWRPQEKIYLKYTLARLLTHRHSPGQGRDYGWESDITASYMLSGNLQVFAELNLLRPGSYFNRVTNGREHVASELLFGISYLFYKL